MKNAIMILALLTALPGHAKTNAVERAQIALEKAQARVLKAQERLSKAQSKASQPKNKKNPDCLKFYRDAERKGIEGGDQVEFAKITGNTECLELIPSNSF